VSDRGLSIVGIVIRLDSRIPVVDAQHAQETALATGRRRLTGWQARK
jgi:hypothetical protein